MGNDAAKEELNENIRPLFANIDNTTFDINNINDLNDRFIQFKNYCY
ncbi:MAG: hypothetical protein MJ195_01305 [Mycoplasmoidaceae bacterium]|nr:hypothetical protein [Mycoplasmoidaceae bacterium]